MPFWFRWLLATGTTLFLVPQFFLPAAGQNPLTGPVPEPISSLRLLIRNSGYVFDGTVLSVERVAEAETGTVGSVQITFRVEQAIRGVSNGQVLSIREWAGLWNSGERYRSGERLLLFLYSPSKLGFTSPVGGALGRFAVDSGGNVIFDKARLAALLPVQDQPVQNRPVQNRSIQNPLVQNPNVQVPMGQTTGAKLPGQRRMNSHTLAVLIDHMARE